MEHGIMFTREERIEAHAGFGGKGLEAPAFDLVRDKDLALFPRQLIQGLFELLQEEASGIKRVGAGIG
jgi:hypothetical protein